MVKVTSPFKILYVDEQDEDKRKMIKYATEHVPYYNPRAGYGYYEFTVKGYVLPERNVIAKNKVCIISNGSDIYMHYINYIKLLSLR